MSLEFVPESYKTQKMCDVVVSTPPSTIKFVPECITSHEMYDKAVNKCFSYIKKTVSKSLKYNIYL